MRRPDDHSPRVLLALAVGLTLLLCACGSGSGSGETSEPATTTIGVATTLTTPPPSGRDPAAVLQLRPVLGEQTCSTPTTTTRPSEIKPGTPETTAAPRPQPELVPDEEGASCYDLGRVAADGSDLTEAEATLDQSGQWLVNVRPRAGSVDRLNKLFNTCNEGQATCPASEVGPGRVAIVIDGVVVSAPAVHSQDLADDVFQITGNFTEQEATGLAARLHGG